MDISAPLSWDQLMEIEYRANLIVYENVPVTAIFPTPDELPALEYRSKLDLTENVRIVKIGDYDSCACCAPHVNSTGEIGLIKILDAEKLRGGMRVHIRAGIRAYREVSKLQATLSEISHMLSLPRLDTADGVRKLLSDYEAKSRDFKAAREKYFEREAELVSPTEKNLVLVFPDATQDELRIVANSATKKVGGILVLLSGSDGAYRFVLSSRTTDLRTEVKKITAALGGGGGGSSIMAQGSFTAALTEIEKYFI
jgi:alanyl-tRNA synthetase